jgi:hypothetical protein
MSAPNLTDDEVINRAERWARLHANPKYRDKMDALLEDLSEVDQRRVRLCGQRIAGGLKPKVLPAATSERSNSYGNNTNNAKRGKANGAGRRAETTQTA